MKCEDCNHYYARASKTSYCRNGLCWNKIADFIRLTIERKKSICEEDRTTLYYKENVRVVVNKYGKIDYLLVNNDFGCPYFKDRYAMVDKANILSEIIAKFFTLPSHLIDP